MKKLWINLLCAAALCAGCQTTAGSEASEATDPTAAATATEFADVVRTVAKPKTKKLKHVRSNSCDDEPHTLFTVAMTGSDTLNLYFDNTVRARDVIALWSEQADQVQDVVRSSSYAGRMFSGFRTALRTLETAINGIDPDMTFTGMIFSQHTNATLDAAMQALRDGYLDLGFLDLPEVTTDGRPPLAQLRTLIDREELLLPFDLPTANKAGLGDVSISQLYSTPASEDNIPDRADIHITGKLANTGGGTRETNDIGDLLTVLNANRILWKQGAIECTAPGSESGNSKCCCNDVNHDGTPPTTDGHLYRTCKQGTPEQNCVQTCLGKCCMASLTWCPTVH